ncbi:MAG: sulfite exporter TauE/SafE family protein [Candidatus Ratteibacteria bacterium]
MANFILFIILGIFSGVISGLLGIGGATIIVPALIYFFGFSQHQAQGTTLLLMVPPIGILAALTYYKKGYADIPTAIFICIGFFIGAYLGAKIAISIPEKILRKIFGLFLLIISFHMIFKK